MRDESQTAGTGDSGISQTVARTAYHVLRTLLLPALLLAQLAVSSTAAEIRLKPQCKAEGPLVKLGDVAEIVDADGRPTKSLAGVELFPATQQRFVGVREIQDLLLLRGVNLAEHQFTGSSQVAVTSEARSSRPEPGQASSLAAARRANRRVCEAVVKYLEQRAREEGLETGVTTGAQKGGGTKTRPAGDRRRTVEAELSESQARLLADPGRTISISGGRAPWTGVQRLEVTVHTTEGPLSFPLEARVKVPSAVVMASHSLQRGVVIRPEDVELGPSASDEDGQGAIGSLEEVIGRETTRAVAAGRPLSTDSLRAPLLVRKGDVVTVFALNAGIRVRTTARARDDGSQGDLVAVDSLLDHSSYFARVSRIREVEVYARSARVEQAEAGPSEAVIRR